MPLYILNTEDDRKLWVAVANNPKCWLKGETSINYCPSFNDEYRKPMNIVPIFNNDHEPCLPGFILEYDKGQYQHSFEKYKDDHRRKILEYTAKKKDLLEPRPNKRHRYCGVCKLNYDEYREHLVTREHRDSFNRNKYVTLIDKISKQFNITGIDESNQTTTVAADILQQFKTEQQPLAKKRGRPRLTEEQKRLNKLEREERKRLGQEPVPKKKPKIEMPACMPTFLQPSDHGIGHIHHYIYQPKNFQ